MKKVHIALAIWIIVFKILVISSLIYVGYNLTELRKDIEAVKIDQLELKKQMNENQALNQEQITEISSSLITVKKDLNDEIEQLKASAGSDFSAVIEDVIPAVVSVGTDISQGSGFIISSNGYVITNAHVLSGGKYVRILNYQSDSWKTATLVGYDENMDVAVLKIDGNNYDYLKFANSDNLKVGEKAIALGNPLGLSFSVSEGIISALDRVGPNNIPGYIQIDVPLNRGNSGGPLVNKNGEIIGINNFKLQNSENLGFALESNLAEETINKIFQQNSINITV